MNSTLPLRERHQELGARFATSAGMEVVADYGDGAREYRALTQVAGLADLSFRGRVCLTGSDRVRLLHGQVTNEVQKLATGEGCYAALVTNKGKMLADANIYALAQELLLDFEPGLTLKITERLDHYIVADDVQVIDVAPHYALFSIQGPRSAEIMEALANGRPLPTKDLGVVHWPDARWGDVYVARHPRGSFLGFDCFLPESIAGEAFTELQRQTQGIGGSVVGFDAMELIRFEAGIPRFGVDMDETNLPPEAGIDSRAVSYSKGCYIGQEVIARIRTYGQVAKALRRLRLPDGLESLPVKGDRLFRDGKEVGSITSAHFCPAHGRNIAMAYIRRETNAPGSQLILRTSASEIQVEVLSLNPFVTENPDRKPRR